MLYTNCWCRESAPGHKIDMISGEDVWQQQKHQRPINLIRHTTIGIKAKQDCCGSTAYCKNFDAMLNWLCWHVLHKGHSLPHIPNHGLVDSGPLPSNPSFPQPRHADFIQNITNFEQWVVSFLVLFLLILSLWKMFKTHHELECMLWHAILYPGYVYTVRRIAINAVDTTVVVASSKYISACNQNASKSYD